VKNRFSGAQNADAGESVFAITDGTGRYAGAQGQLSLRPRDSGLHKAWV
jgi:hypothetical protein